MINLIIPKAKDILFKVVFIIFLSGSFISLSILRVDAVISNDLTATKLECLEQGKELLFKGRKMLYNAEAPFFIRICFQTL